MIEKGSRREVSGKSKDATGLRKLLYYCKSHMWCSFAMAILVSVLLLLILILGYMKKQYYTYLVETTYTTEKALLNAVNKNIESQLENYVNIGANISVNEDFTDELFSNFSIEQGAERNKAMKTTLKTIARTSTQIVGMALADENGILYQYDKNERIGDEHNLWGDEQGEDVVEVFNLLKDKNTQNSIPRYEILTQPMIHPNTTDKGIVHIAFPLKNSNLYRDIQYMLIVTYYNEELEKLLKQLNDNQEKYIQGYIETEDGSILLHTNDKYIGRKANIYETEKNLTDLTKEIGNYGWRLHAVIDEEILHDKVDGMYQKMVFIFFLAIFVILMILFWVTNRILRPANIISNSISRVKNGNIREQIPIEGTNEIWQLVQEYNEMLQAIQKANQEVEEQHNQVIEFMKMKQRAEREALESQINAHFICNTLNAINYEAMDSGNYKVSVLLKKLSNILRYTFDQKHQNVYMFQEIAWIEQYLFLQKERLGNVFEYEIDFDSDYDNWPCRKLMLQPFVENSILHGFEGKQWGGKIKIIGKGYKEFLKIIIEDNGAGMESGRETVIREILKEPVLAKKQQIGIGISNVIARMRMYYGKKFQVFFETEPGKGTRFTFILPLPPKANSNKKRKSEISQ